MSTKNTLGSKNSHFLKPLGAILSIAGIAYVSYALYGQKDNINLIHFNVYTSVLLVASIATWQISNVSIGLGWWNILHTLAYRIPLRTAILFTLKTQIAKYLPGNVFHLIGRALLLKQIGISTLSSSKSLLLETILVVLVSCFIGAIYFLPTFFKIIGAIAVPISTTLTVSLIIFLSKKLGKFALTNHPSRSALFLAVFSYVTLFFLQTVIFFFVVVALYPELGVSYSTLAPLYCISWVAGYITIGSPGGLGVREGIFSILVAENEHATSLVFSMVVFRLVAIIGDAISYLISLLIQLNYNKN